MSDLRECDCTYGPWAADEIERLTARCEPNAVVMIGGAGFYVQQKVAERIAKLEGALTIIDMDTTNITNLRHPSADIAREALEAK